MLLLDGWGASPVWSRDGTQIYFLAGNPGDVVMMVADVIPGDDFETSPAMPLIDPWPYLQTIPARAYDVLADGSFVALLEDFDEGGDANPGDRERFRVEEFHVVLNWFDELRERVPN